MELHWVEKALKKTSISQSGCWLSSYAVTSSGYSKICVGRKNFRVHRLSYEFFRGEIPEGVLVCHKCDVRNCWNPEHLFLGTSKENFDDMVSKGRRFRGIPDLHYGEAVKSSVLTRDKVREIRRRSFGGESKTLLALEFGVSLSTICRVVNRKIWAWLD